MQTREYLRIWNRWRDACIQHLPWNVAVQISAFELEPDEPLPGDCQACASGDPKQLDLSLPALGNNAAKLLVQLDEARVEVTYYWSPKRMWTALCSQYYVADGWVAVERWPIGQGSDRLEELTVRAVTWLKAQNLKMQSESAECGSSPCQPTSASPPSQSSPPNAALQSSPSGQTPVADPKSD